MWGQRNAWVHGRPCCVWLLVTWRKLLRARMNVSLLSDTTGWALILQFTWSGPRYTVYIVRLFAWDAVTESAAVACGDCTRSQSLRFLQESGWREYVLHMTVALGKGCLVSALLLVLKKSILIHPTDKVQRIGVSTGQLHMYQCVGMTPKCTWIWADWTMFLYTRRSSCSHSTNSQQQARAQKGDRAMGEGALALQ